MSQLETLAKSMSAGTVAREVINNPITLQSTVNGALVTVQKNSIAHAELAQGENGMLVKGYNPQNRGRVFAAGVGFNPDGTIKGREHLVGQPQRVPGADVTAISPAQAAVRARGNEAWAGGQEAQSVVETSSAEVEIADANDRAAQAGLLTAEANQKLAESQRLVDAQAAEIAALKAATSAPAAAAVVTDASAQAAPWLPASPAVVKKR
jgi:hypothetical protein